MKKVAIIITLCSGKKTCQVCTNYVPGAKIDLAQKVTCFT